MNSSIFLAHFSRIFIWLFVLGFALHYRSRTVGALAVMGIAANYLAATYDDSTRVMVASILFSMMLPLIAFVLIDFAHTHNRTTEPASAAVKRIALSIAAGLGVVMSAVGLSEIFKRLGG